MPNSDQRTNIFQNFFNRIYNFWKQLAYVHKQKDLYSNALNKLLSKDDKIDDMSKLILENYVQFIDKTVEDILIPRSDVFGVKSTATIAEINQALIQHFHTRILVYENNLDNVVGFIHIKDLYKNFISGSTLKPLDLIRKPLTVVDSTKLVKLLAQMQKDRTHLAVVVDEYGGTKGIVTNENVIEALVGEIRDEHDKAPNDKEEYQLLNESTLVINARARIEKVEELLNIDLQKEQYDCDTIGGLVTAIANKVPPVNTVFMINDNVQAEVIDANKRYLKTIKVKLLEDA